MFFKRQTMASQTAFANLDSASRQAHLTRDGSWLDGGFTTKKIGGGNYTYYQYKQAGKVHQIYLGGDSRALDELKLLMAKPCLSKEHLKNLGTSAVELGASLLKNTEFDVISGLANHRFFEAGGVLVGTSAFLAFQNMLGVTWHLANRTEDIDFAHAGRKLSLAFPDAVVSDTSTAIESLKMGFIPNKSGTTFTHPDEPDFQLDFLTAKVKDGDDPIRFPQLNITLQPLKFMEFSMEDTSQTTLISKKGVVVVNVPNPGRFALHKLLISSERRGNGKVKAYKDLEQAACLIDYLVKEDPHTLSKAWDAIKQNGPGWLKRCNEGLASLQREYSFIDLSFANSTEVKTDRRKPHKSKTP
jgi:hypothetical protein